MTQIQTAVSSQRIRARRLMVDTPVPVQPVAAPAPVVAQAQGVPDELQSLARDYYVANKLSNAATRQADKAKSTLHQQMLAANVSAFDTEVTIEGVAARVHAEISAEDAEYVDINLLRSLVDEATFLRIVTATKTAVTEHAGRNVLAGAVRTKPGKPDLRIKGLRL